MVTNTVDPPDEASGGSTSTLTTSPAPVRSSSNSKKPRKKRISPAKQNSGSGTPEAGAAGVFVPPKTSLVYNEYGELVDIEKIKRPHSSADLSVTETLRLIRKAYHHEFRTRMSDVITVQVTGDHSFAGEDGRLSWKGRLFSWDFTPKTPVEMSPEEVHSLYTYKGPSRVLEIGCGDGEWCFRVKEEHQDWIVEGLDDADHWTKKHHGVKIRDFMEPATADECQTVPLVDGHPDYFGRIHMSQDTAEFTVRNLSQLTAHLNPIPNHIYSFVRARDIFDKVESYKGFLEDVRQILQPEGVVEFLEVDPRPRVSVVDKRRSSSNDHTSGPETNWTDNIADRFKDPHDEQLATNVPEWTQRVEERLKATLRPKDGVPAANLKSWLEGAGFWDVKQVVLRLPVGGSSSGGKLLLDVMKQQVALENQIPTLAANLPQIDFDKISKGNYFINMHIVTARKPKYPRPGDKLMDGTRQEMTAQKYDAMKKLNDGKSSHQWRRFNLDGKLATMMQKLRILQGGPDQGGQNADDSDAPTPDITEASDLYVNFQPPERERGGRAGEGMGREGAEREVEWDAVKESVQMQSVQMRIKRGDRD